MLQYKRAAALLALPLLLSVGGCKATHDTPTHHTTRHPHSRGATSSPPAPSGTTVPGTVAVDSSGTPAGVLEDPVKRGGNYYALLGKAKFDKTCNTTPGYNYTGVLNGAGQVGPACAVVVAAHKRVDPIEDPAGYSKNGKASIPYINGKKSYNGYFYNRSHLVSAVLGGAPTKENLITGTRTQNVGDGNTGGMRYTERQAEAYLKDGDKAAKCPLTYEVTPHYRNTTDAVPTWVQVDMKTCNASLDQEVAVFNDAAGYTIDYATGAWRKN